jgi:hypothetical protein
MTVKGHASLRNRKFRHVPRRDAALRDVAPRSAPKEGSQRRQAAARQPPRARPATRGHGAAARAASPTALASHSTSHPTLSAVQQLLWLARRQGLGRASVVPCGSRACGGASPGGRAEENDPANLLSAAFLRLPSLESASSRAGVSNPAPRHASAAATAMTHVCHADDVAPALACSTGAGRRRILFGLRTSDRAGNARLAPPSPPREEESLTAAVLSSRAAEATTREPKRQQLARGLAAARSASETMNVASDPAAPPFRSLHVRLDDQIRLYVGRILGLNNRDYEQRLSRAARDHVSDFPTRVARHKRAEVAPVVLSSR